MKKFTSPLIGASVPVGFKAIKDFSKLKLGNIVLIIPPDTLEEALQVMNYCREHRIYVMLGELIRRASHTRKCAESLSSEDLEKVFAAAGEYFLGRYAIGESGGVCYWPKQYVLPGGANFYKNLPPCSSPAEAHEKYVDYLRGMLEYERETLPASPLYSVESSLFFEYHAQAGLNGLCIEMLVGDPLIMLPGIRGAARARGMLWGAHVAMIWYGGMCFGRLWLMRWRLSLALLYMGGVDFVYPESGHYDYFSRGPQRFEFDSPEMHQSRMILREMYRFSRIHTRPAGGPLTPTGVVFGNHEGNPAVWNPYCWGQYDNGVEWERSEIERGWDLLNAFNRRSDPFRETVFGDECRTGNPPAGQYDIVPAGAGNFNNYRFLLFVGYNEMDEALYAKLLDFVRRGGHLLIALTHFDVSRQRGGEIRLFRDGDISELCGVKITGRGEPDVHGLKYVNPSMLPGRVFPLRSPNRDPTYLGKITPAKVELTGGDDTQVCAGISGYCRDRKELIEEKPVLIEHRLGLGNVLLVTTFNHPGSEGLKVFYEDLIRCSLEAERPELSLLSGDSVRYSIYRAEAGFEVVYLLNTDFELTQNYIVARGERRSAEHSIPAGSMRLLYAFDGLTVTPRKCEVELKRQDGDELEFFLAESQELRLENLSDRVRSGSLNGVAFTLPPGEGAVIEAAALVPDDERAEFYAADYLDEPSIDVGDTLVPY